MEFGAYFIGVVKTNTKGLFKDIVEKITKDWPVSSYLMLRSNPMVTGGRPLIFIGYKCNTREVLSFNVTENSGITQVGIPHLSKYPD